MKPTLVKNIYMQLIQMAQENGPLIAENHKKLAHHAQFHQTIRFILALQFILELEAISLQ